MRAWLGTAGVLVLIGIWAAPAQSAQTPAEFFEWPDGLREFHLSASKGYQLRISDTGRRNIFLTAQKGRASVQYQVRGKRTGGNGIDARLPGIGRIVVAFRPIGRPHLVPVADNCKGRGNLVQHGVFEGTIHFRGERDYARADASRAKGKVVKSFKQTCRSGGDGSGGAELHLTFLDASDFHQGGLVGFSAFKLTSTSQPGFDDVSFGATLGSTRHGMSVFRSVSANSGSASMVSTSQGQLPDSLTVTPPSPFKGSGEFKRISKSSTSWSGSLSVEFPGTGPISLAGPSFSPEVCVDNRCTGGSDSSHIVFANRRH